MTGSGAGSSRAGGPHPREYRSGHDVVPDPHPKSNVHTVLAGQRQQQLRTARTAHTRTSGRAAAPPSRAGVDAASSTLPNRPFTTARVSSSTRLPIASTWMECARWSAKYTTMARLANNNAIAPLTASRGNSSVRSPADYAHRVQARHGVGEGRDERAEHDLGRPIAQEAPQQPWRKLRRRQLQRNHRQAQHQCDHGHHRAGHVAQQGARIISGTLERQRRPRTDVDAGQNEPDHQRQHGADPGQHP